MRSNRLTVLSISFAQKEDVSFLCTPKCHNGGGDSCTINCKQSLETGVSAQWAGEERCHGALSVLSVAQETVAKVGRWMRRRDA